MKAFVAGATGLTGRHLVAALVEQGCAVTAHVRPDSRRREHWHSYFEERGAEVDFTPWELPMMEQRMGEANPQLVFGVLGSTRDRAKRGDGRYDTVDYGLTALLIDALRGRPQPVRFVYVSSLGADNAVRSAYLEARHKTEAYLQKSGLPFLIVRPSFITGVRDDERPMEQLGAKMLDGLLRGVSALGATEMADRLSSMDAGDLAWALSTVSLYWQRDDQILDASDLRGWTDRSLRPLEGK